MKNFDGIMICTDLDGTLIASDHVISKENLDAIEYFKANGGLFTFITGRMPYFARSAFDAVRPNAPVGCVNGGGIYDYETEKYIYQLPLSHEANVLVRAVEDAVEGVGIQINTFDEVLFYRDSPTNEGFRLVTGVPYRPCTLEDVTVPYAKVLFVDSNEEVINAVRRVLDTHPESCKYDFIRSERSLYEILPKGSGKGAILAPLARHLGVRPPNIVAVGDYDNDVSMLKEAGVGIAVANASPAALEAADFVTVSNEEHAIAKIIHDIEAGVYPVTPTPLFG